jgi:hypothetical protein
MADFELHDCTKHTRLVMYDETWVLGKDTSEKLSSEDLTVLLRSEDLVEIYRVSMAA